MTDTKAIRRQMKQELGYNARQVSVRYSRGSAIYFTIRDASVNPAKVKKFAAQFESVRWCEVTQEILSGGNTFVFVECTDAVLEAFAAPHLEKVEAAALEVTEGSGLRIEGTAFTLFAGRGGYGFKLFKDHGIFGEYNTVAAAASAIGYDLASNEEN